MKANCYGQTDLGLVRKENEDFYLTDTELNLYVVCDGVGGRPGGKVASETAARVIRECILKNKIVIDRYNQHPSGEGREQVMALVSQAILAANQAVRNKGAEDTALREMCTTADLLLITEDHAFLGHVGDSRIYLLREGRVHQLTQDHRVASEMQKQGLWTEEQAKRSGYANVLSRAIGESEFLQPDTLLVELATDDHFLLCSDGLASYFQNEELKDYVSKFELPRVPTELIRFAKEKGGAR